MAKRYKDIKHELINDKQHQEKKVISVEKVKKQCRKMPIWKAPGKDGIQGY